jgi:ABC-type amino acid transport substrate-binding protein
MAPGDLELKQHVDAALAALAADGTVARTLAGYHVPYFAPFPETERKPEGQGQEQEQGQDHGHTQGNAESLIRHAVADRGREPQMQRVQTSRHPYEGLARVRSAGALVVGLDQNNLPFSTAHPEPKGLDYEIAGLLAEQLGVALRVYWAYSAHDSYASKLAARKQCDVILGITPDDRFAGRVLYSRPYALASYRLVVRRGAGAPAESSPLGVEEGVAIRGLGLGGRKTVPYPSLEAILADVAGGKLAAGYVVATRGSWLAHERWPGQLEFLPGPASADRFPLVAAVRKSDRDLKDAIDRAWDELERSGRLARAFERWHVTFETGARP